MTFPAVAQHVCAANTARHAMETAMTEFDALCQAGLWDAAKVARQRVVGSMESYCDNLMAAYRSIQRETRR